MRTLGEEIKKQGFDLTVNHRDEKTGLITHSDPYILRVVAGQGSEKNRYWERPVGSGNLWDKKGNPCGRWDMSLPVGKRYVADAAHVAFERPLTGDQLLARDLMAKDAENAALRAEIAAIKKESAPAKVAKQAAIPKES